MMTTKNTTISYGKSDDAWTGYKDFIINQIKSAVLKDVCDIGGGANPQLDTSTINELGINYALLDISEAELNKAPDQYEKIHADIASHKIKTDLTFDLMFSKMLAEHVRDGALFHKNVFDLLNPGGIAVHFFPTLYTLPFFVNRVFPETLTDKLLNYFAQRDRYQHDKFPAYYSWCRGPTRRQIKKFNAVGYEVIEYRGFYGHSDYYKRIKPLKILHEMKTQYLLKHPNPVFTSFSYVVLRKPD